MLRLFSALSRTHPLLYLLTYIILVPIFGLIYWGPLRNQFYAPYIRAEPAAIRDTDELRGELEASLSEMLITKTEFDVEGVGVRILYVSVVCAEATNDHQVIYCLNVEVGRNDRPGVRYPFFARIKTTTKFWKKPGGGRYIIVDIISTTQRGLASSSQRAAIQIIRKLLQAPFSKEDKDRLLEEAEAFYIGEDFSTILNEALSSPMIPMSESADRRMQFWMNGLDGNPSSVGGSLLRMIYFSATTLTTAGLGDIIPVTPWARSVVAIQGVLGITLAGLFLNAIAYRASSSSSI